MLNCCMDRYSQEEYTINKMSMVGADYLQVTMYLHCVVHLQSFNLMVGRFMG